MTSTTSFSYLTVNRLGVFFEFKTAVFKIDKEVKSSSSSITRFKIESFLLNEKIKCLSFKKLLDNFLKPTSSIKKVIQTFLNFNKVNSSKFKHKIIIFLLKRVS